MKTYEMTERRPSLVHLYAGFAMCCDGETSIRVALSDEQIVQLAADACELAAKILRWEKQQCVVESPLKASPTSGSTKS